MNFPHSCPVRASLWSLGFLLLTGLPAAVQAQQPPPSDPTLHPSPTAQRKAFEPAADEEYTLDGGDEITVEAAGHPELSGKHIIGPDGRMTLPTIGVIDLKGLTREQASAAVQKAFDVYYRDASVSINIDKYGSNRVMVLGAVEHPGPVLFDQTPTLLEAITRAGLMQQSGVQTISTGKSAQSTKPLPPQLPQECKIYRGEGEKQQVITVNLRQLLSSGSADMRLRRNDVVFVPNPQDRFVSVIGEVRTPGAVQLTDATDLTTILAEAGGLTEFAGNNPTLSIVDPATRKTRTIRFKQLITPEGMNEVALQPGDLIYVPKSGLAKVGFVFQQISPVTSIASVAAVSGVF